MTPPVSQIQTLLGERGSFVLREWDDTPGATDTSLEVRSLRSYCCNLDGTILHWYLIWRYVTVMNPSDLVRHLPRLDPGGARGAPAHVCLKASIGADRRLLAMGCVREAGMRRAGLRGVRNFHPMAPSFHLDISPASSY